MSILALATVTYAVTVAAPDSGYSLSLNRTNCFISPTVPTIIPPSNIAISANGSFVAFVEYPTSPHCGEDRIVLIHNKRRVTIMRPESDTPSDDTNDYSVPTLKITDSGELFATLSDRFSGAYMGVRKKSFAWSNQQWHLLELSGQNTASCQSNVGIAAAETNRLFATTSDCDAEFLPSLEEANDPRYATNSFIIHGDNTIAIGSGTLTSLRNDVAAGYSDGFHHSIRPEVFLWNNMRRSSLGRGVGFGVDTDGDVVGDNRRSWDDTGSPTIWRKNKVALTINTLVGSAFAIRDGLIVGYVADRAFVASSKNLPQSIRLLQEVSDRIKILRAFAIAQSGQILALGKDKDGSLEVLVLHHPEVRTR